MSSSHFVPGMLITVLVVEISEAIRDSWVLGSCGLGLDPQPYA